MTTRPLLRAYVDETGDRGYTGRSSPFFAFACVLVPDEHDRDLCQTVAELRRELEVGSPLHWSQHVKTFPRRQHATRTLLTVPGVQVFYVVVDKDAIPTGSRMRRDHAVFYNQAAGIVVEKALTAAAAWPGGARALTARFAQVRGFDHSSTTAHLARRMRNDPWIPWPALTSGAVHFDAPTRRDGLQAADAYAGMLSAAARPDRYGNYEPPHLLAVRSQLWHGPGGPPITVLGDERRLTGLPWWPEEGL